MEYKTVSFIESSGNSSLGVKINVSLDRDLTTDEKREIDKYVEKIHEMLIESSRKLDPKLLESAKKEKEQLIELFNGYTPIYVEEIPNGYDRDPIFPWFTITTWIGRFNVGWRKRVIVIDWEDTTFKKTAEEIFPKEDVTKSGRMIHAYGYEAARNYIDTIFAHCSE